jgi:hypothetical protein
MRTNQLALSSLFLAAAPVHSAANGEAADPEISTGGICALVLLSVFSVVLLMSCVYQSRKNRRQPPEFRILRCGGCRRAFRVPASIEGASFMCSRCVTEGRRRASEVSREEREERFQKMRESARKTVHLQRLTSTYFQLVRGGSSQKQDLKRDNLSTPMTSESEGSVDECKICFDDESSIVLLPCGHGGLCEGCAKDLVTITKECYICRTEVELLAKIRKTRAELAGEKASEIENAHLVAPDTLHHLTSRQNTSDIPWNLPETIEEEQSVTEDNPNVAIVAPTASILV